MLIVKAQSIQPSPYFPQSKQIMARIRRVVILHLSRYPSLSSPACSELGADDARGPEIDQHWHTGLVDEYVVRVEVVVGEIE